MHGSYRASQVERGITKRGKYHPGPVRASPRLLTTLPGVSQDVLCRFAEVCPLVGRSYHHPALFS